MYLSKNQNEPASARLIENYEEEKEEDFNNNNKGRKKIQKKEPVSSKLMQLYDINVDKKTLKKTKKHNKKVKHAFGIKKREKGLEDIMKEEDDKTQPGLQESKRMKGKKEDSSNSDNESEKETKKKKIDKNQELKIKEFKMDLGQEKSEI